MAKKLYIIDGYGFVFRAYHSMPPLTNSAGVPVGAVYGFINMLTKLLKEHKPDYICVAFDSGKETFRTEMYSAYKANRPPAPDDLIPQFPLVREVVDVLGLQSFELVGYEADDIIATFTKRALEQDIEVTIISSDKDLMQLVQDNKVRMFDPVRTRFVHEKEVFEKFGVTPEKVLDACALIGDSSDNVPGAPGIGPKTAAELILEYGDLDSLLTRAGEIKQPKRREVLQNSKDQILMSRELIRLHYDVPVAVEFEKLAPQNNDAKLLQFCQEHGFKSIVAKLVSGGSNYKPASDDSVAAIAPAKPVVAKATLPRVDTVIKTQAELKNWLKGELEKVSIYFLGEVGVSLAKENAACLIKFASKSTDLFAPAEGLTKDEVMAELKPILENNGTMKVAYDLKSIQELA
jgi:DNA polymerase-1